MRGVIFAAALSLMMGCSNTKQASDKFVQWPKAYRPIFYKEQLPKENYAEGMKIAISTSGKGSALVAKEIQEKGGNLVDVSVALAFALSVERPHDLGLGGGGFLLYKPANLDIPISLDFRERASLELNSKKLLAKVPKKINKDLLEKQRPFDSQIELPYEDAIATPGMVKGLIKFHREFGKLPLAQLLAPAIKLAEKGITVSSELSKAIEDNKEKLSKDSRAKSIYFKENGSVYLPGEILVQKDLAKTLNEVSQSGDKSFYEGKISQEFVNALKGKLSLADFKSYKVKRPEVLKTQFNGHNFYTMGPPSSGGISLIQALKVLEKSELRNLAPMHPKAIHKTVSALQFAAVDRAKYLGDPDYTTLRLNKMISEDYIEDLYKAIPEHMHLNYSEASFDFMNTRFKAPYESAETAQISLMDSDGNTVVMTLGLNGVFGSGVVAGSTGIVMNSALKSFNYHPKKIFIVGPDMGKNNLAEPGKAPISNMAPTIITDQKDMPVLSIGATGGNQIPSCLGQTILNLMEYKLPVKDSLLVKRYHHQWMPDEIVFESMKLPKRVKERLVIMKHDMKFEDLKCRVQFVKRNGEKLQALSDPRGESISWAN
ncbi:MAG: gamma-glutamyltransferase [Bacteriovoracaceae bacterium]